MFKTGLLICMALSILNSQETKTKFKVVAQYFGDPYIYVRLYIDNPPTNNEPSKRIKPLFSRDGNKTNDHQEFIIEGYKKGDHTLDVYIGYPGNNRTLCSIELIKIVGNKETLVGSYYEENLRAPLRYVGPAEPKHKRSIDFTIK